MTQTSIAQTVSVQASTWGRLAVTCVAHMTEHLYVGVNAVVLPVMVAALGLNMSQVGLLVSARSLVAGFSNIPSGLLADLINRRSLLLGLSLIIIGLSSLLMSFASGFWALMFMMAFGAIGAGGFHPQSLAILSSAYSNRRALALGFHDSSGNLGEVVAPLTIGFLLTYVDWRGTLQIWAIPGLVIGLSYALFCREINGSSVSKTRLTRSLWEDVIKNRAVFGMFLISAFRAMGQTALITFLPLYLTLYLQQPAAVMGFYVSILLFFAAIAPSCSGWISDRVGRVPLMVAGSALSGLFIAALPNFAPGIPLIIGCALVGTMLWAVRPIIFAAAMEVTPPQLAGSLVGFMFTGNIGLSFVGPLLAGVIADTHGLPVALAFVGVFPLLACAIALTPLTRPRL